MVEISVAFEISNKIKLFKIIMMDNHGNFFCGQNFGQNQFFEVVEISHSIEIYVTVEISVKQIVSLLLAADYDCNL